MSFRERMRGLQNLTLEFEAKRKIKLDSKKYVEFCNIICNCIENNCKDKILRKEFRYDSGFIKKDNYRYEIRHLYGVCICTNKFNGLDYDIEELSDAYGRTGYYGIRTCYLEDINQVTSRILRRLTDDFHKLELSVYSNTSRGEYRKNINQSDIVFFKKNTAQKYLTCPKPYIISSCQIGLNVILYCTKTGEIE